MKSQKGHLLSLPANRRVGVRTARPSRSPTTVDRWLAGRLLDLLGDPPIELRLWDGEPVRRPRGTPVARVTFRDRDALLRLLRQPDLHFGDAYASGGIDVDGDLVCFLESSFIGLERAADSGEIPGRVWRLLGRMSGRRRNTLGGSRDNIRHHYDLGNDFYRLWLDHEMVYTCAYFTDAQTDLETAQRSKMDHVCRKLRLKPGERVVEAGCGWGSLARHMARHYGVRVTAFNISEEQVGHARERARAEGLEDRVEYVLDDYRNIAGRFDAFVSVGMLEHVGTECYRDLGATIDRTLTADGRGLIHSIGRNRPNPMNAWIERRIFPGAYPPTLQEMMNIFEPWAFSILDVENLRMHYAATLRHWLERFETGRTEVERMYDPFFVRAWRLYLAGSIAAFTTGNLQLFQVLFTRQRNNDLPLTRAHLYAGANP